MRIDSALRWHLGRNTVTAMVRPGSAPPAPFPVHAIADGVHAVGPWGRTRTMVYLVRSGSRCTLVDAGWPGDGPRLRATIGSVIGAENPVGIVLTHVHPDHEGDARTLAEAWGCPVWVSPRELPIAARDFDAMQAVAMPLDRWIVLPMMRTIGRRRRARIFADNTLAPVAHALSVEEPVPGLPEWRCIPTPGHTAGHVSLFRARDRVLLSGDALVTVQIDTLRHLLQRRNGLSAPPWYTTWDASTARSSIRTLAELGPRILAPGHGMPLKDAAAAITRFTQTA